MIIARLVAELRCYLPEGPTPAWARLRHLGARRAGLVTAGGAARQQVRDLLDGPDLVVGGDSGRCDSVFVTAAEPVSGRC